MSRWQPLYMRSVGGSSLRASYMPRLVTGPFAASAAYYDDFINTNWAPGNYASGLTATPDTLVNLAPFGNPAWVCTEVVGTNGLCGQATDAVSIDSAGVFLLQSGTTSGNLMAMDTGGPSSTGGVLVKSDGSTRGFLCQWRVAASHAATTGRHGFGLVSSTTIGTDWITDPDTTLAATNSIVFHRDGTSAYSGDTQSAWVFRYYSSTGPTALSAEVITGPTNVQYYVVELYFTGTTFYVYVDRALVATVAATNYASSTYRMSAQVMATSAAARQIKFDSVYFEQQLVAAR